MKINKKDVLYLILMLLPYLFMVYVIVRMPDKIPVSLFDTELEWKSKYHAVFISVMLGVTEIVVYCYLIWCRKKEFSACVESRKDVVSLNTNKNSNILFLDLMVVMSILYCVTLYLQFQIAIEMQIFVMDWCSKVSCIAFGIIFLLMGNVQPRMHEEIKDPIEKKWKKLDYKTLRKINHFTAVCIFSCGIIIILLGVFGRGIVPLICSGITLLLTAILCTIYSYVAYARSQKEKIYGNTKS